MELRQLERFLAVVEAGSLAGAARQLQLTQQAVSASLQTLETDIGLRLLDRQPGGTTRLTEFGRALLPHARAQLAADERARRSIASLATAHSGTATIGIGETFAGDIIAEAVNRLLAERPALRVNLVEGYSEHLLQRLEAGEFDFIAAGISAQVLPAGLAAKVVYHARDVIACRRDHPLCKRRRLSLADLSPYPWLVPYSRPSDMDAIVSAFAAEGLTPPTRFTGTDAYRIGMKLLAKGDFLIMTSPALLSSGLAREHYGLRILPIDKPSVLRTASLVHSEVHPLTPAATLLFDLIAKLAAAEPAPNSPKRR
jgi:DNA-binding transcriptional LysR family regulator